MTVQYRQDRGAMLPVRVHTIVVSVQHDEVVCLDEMRDALKEKVVKAVVPSVYLDDDTIYHLQPSGRFVIGGPQVETTTNHAVLSNGDPMVMEIKSWILLFIYANLEVFFCHFICFCFYITIWILFLGQF